MASIQDLPDYPIKRDFSLIRDKLLRNKPFALEAPTGSGKTTLLPVLLYLSGMSKKKILVTQPRRIAAKNTAGRISMLLGTRPGETAGYRVRGESNTGASTVIEVVTEGYALAMLQADPFLSGYDWVILDEFHERHIEADLLLAFLRDLKMQFGAEETPSLILMSATWQGQPVGELGEFNFHTVEGSLYPVQKIFLEGSPESSLEARLKWGIRRALAETSGKILVFLPGRREIASAQTLLAEIYPELKLSPLHGGLDLNGQTKVLQYSGTARQVILSTSIAETSLTIEGITAVVDSGLERMPLFRPSGALTRLVTRRLSRATAEQRAGRAGRLGPGKCYRLWSSDEDAELIERWEPEILTGDLSPVRLQTAVWGATSLPWLTSPPEGPWLRAGQLLKELGALDGDEKPTGRGRIMCRMPLPPRLAHMVIESKLTERAALSAAILSEGLRGSAKGISFSAVLADAAGAPGTSRLKRQAADIRRLSAKYLKTGTENGSSGGQESPGITLSFAFPDRIGRKTGDGNYMLSTGAALYCLECSSEWAVFPEIADSGNRLKGIMYEPLSIEELRASAPRLFCIRREVNYRRQDGSFSTGSCEMLGKIRCRQMKAEKPGADEILRAVSEEVSRQGLRVLPFSAKADKLLLRLKAARAAGYAEIPDPDEVHLSQTIGQWLMPFVKDRISSDTVTAALEAMLGWEQRKNLDRLLPEKVELHPGQYKKVDYSNPEQPAVSARMQEFYGLKELPVICEGRLKLAAELLSPAMRPLQITSDLAAFWKGSYTAIRAEMRGRYPKHYWPENPEEAAPSLATGKKRPE